eukprot:TRINITY_DN2165_c0_g1_i2.p1 TRINITY_DN2165_c0_g1~~TRINITY_DN2165_c0_g1_i2.p1  ORF type:complete len:429 (-),score=103.66 TRINITY_DN2165_c0_g1_i2:1801-3087(-)
MTESMEYAPLPTSMTPSAPVMVPDVVAPQPSAEASMMSEKAPDVDGGANLYVGSISPKTTEESLEGHFSPFGEIRAVRLFRKPQKTFGFVEFLDKENAIAAMEALHGKPLDGYTIAVKPANPTGRRDTGHVVQVYIGNIPPEVDDSVLEEEFSEYQSVLSVRILKDENGISRQFGFVTFSSHQEAAQAIDDKNNLSIGGQHIRVNWANAQKRKTSAPPPPRHAVHHYYPGMYPMMKPEFYPPMMGMHANVYVGNLSPETTEDDIRESFSRHVVNLRNIRLLADRGYAFLLFANFESADRAIREMSGAVIRGKQIACSWGRRHPSYMPPYPMGHMSAGFGHPPYPPMHYAPPDVHHVSGHSVPSPSGTMPIAAMTPSAAYFPWPSAQGHLGHMSEPSSRPSPPMGASPGPTGMYPASSIPLSYAPSGQW